MRVHMMEISRDNQIFKYAALAACALMMIACSSTGEEPSPEMLDVDTTVETHCKSSKPRPVQEDGQPFESLDVYLKFRKSQGAFDRPFYQKLDDGRYKLNRGRGERFADPVYFTREELEAKYGFDCPS